MTTLNVSAPSSGESESASSRFVARIFSFVVLVGLVAGVGYLGREGYQAFTDSFVAPMILSPENDLVIQTKLRMSELELERARGNASLEALDAELASCDAAIARLQELKESTSKAIEWTRSITAGQGFAAAGELDSLRKQRAVIADALANQKGLTETARANLEAGLISKTDYTKELQALNQLQVAQLENQRTRTQTELQQMQVKLARKSLAAGKGGSVPMPDVVARADQLVRIELELLKVESEKRSKTAERRLTLEKIEKIDEAESQLKGRPIVRAAEKSMDLAFVPYTQLDGVQQGAGVYDCAWGVFRCKRVGSVSEVVPGEIILPDPWGTPARGQYAILELSQRDAARSKVLRVRPIGAAEPGGSSFWSTFNRIAKK